MSLDELMTARNYTPNDPRKHIHNLCTKLTFILFTSRFFQNTTMEKFFKKAFLETFVCILKGI